MRYIPIYLAALLLASCGFTQTGDTVRGAVVEKGAQAYDEGLVNAEFFICQAASVGSVMRRYGTDPAKMQAWQDLCFPPTETLLNAEPLQAGPGE